MELRIQLSDNGKHTETKFDFKEVESQADLGEFFKVVLKTLESNLKKIPDTPKHRPCCSNELRGINGGCRNCGDPAY